MHIEANSKQILLKRQKLIELKGRFDKYLDPKKPNVGSSLLPSEQNKVIDRSSGSDNMKPTLGTSKYGNGGKVQDSSINKQASPPSGHLSSGSQFNSTLFRNQSLFNQNNNYSQHLRQHQQIPTQYQQAYNLTNWSEEVSGYSVHSANDDQRRNTFTSTSHPRENDILGKIDSLLSSIDKKNYGSLQKGSTNQSKRNNNQFASNHSQSDHYQQDLPYEKNDFLHAQKKQTHKYNLSDLNFGSSLGNQSNNYQFSDSLGSILNRSDHINQKYTQRRPPQKYDEREKKSTLQHYPPSPSEQTISNFNKLKTIQEEQGMNTLTIDHNGQHTGESTSINNIEKQKAKIREAMNARKKMTEQIIKSGRKLESRIENQREGGKGHDEGTKSMKDKEINISVDFDLSDDEQSFNEKTHAKADGSAENDQQERIKEIDSKEKRSKQQIQELVSEKQKLLEELRKVEEQLQRLEFQSEQYD